MAADSKNIHPQPLNLVCDEEAGSRAHPPQASSGNALLEKGRARARSIILKPRDPLLIAEGPDEPLSYELEF